MKNLKHLASYKGNDIMELMDRINALETTRPNELFFVLFTVKVNCDGRWYFDNSRRCHQHAIPCSMSYKFGYDKAYFREEVTKHLAHLDMDFGYEWEGVEITVNRTSNNYGIFVDLHTKAA